jgi:hypothetical protein
VTTSTGDGRLLHKIFSDLPYRTKEVTKMHHGKTVVHAALVAGLMLVGHTARSDC